MGWPWLPVQTYSTCWSCRPPTSSFVRNGSGSSMYPSCCETCAYLSMERPSMTTRRLWRCAMLMTFWMRCTFDAKVVMNTRPLIPAIRVSRLRATSASLAVRPGRSAFVESLSSSSTPSFPACSMRARSLVLPSLGSSSSLKSPVCSTTPAGVVRMYPALSGMECVMRMNSTWKCVPMRTRSVSCTSRRSTSPSLMPNSLSFSRTSPRVRLAPYTGMRGRRGRTYGRLPMWSSWPCVRIMPLISPAFCCR